MRSLYSISTSRFFAVLEKELLLPAWKPQTGPLAYDILYDVLLKDGLTSSETEGDAWCSEGGFRIRSKLLLQVSENLPDFSPDSKGEIDRFLVRIRKWSQDKEGRRSSSAGKRPSVFGNFSVASAAASSTTDGSPLVPLTALKLYGDFPWVLFLPTFDLQSLS